MNLSPSPTPPVVVPVSLHELISQLGSQPGGPRGGHGEVSESQSPPPSHLLPLAPTDGGLAECQEPTEAARKPQ